jgi:hypothetical protein
VYIYYITAAGNSISSQLGSSCEDGTDPSITYKITPAGSHSSTQPGGPPCWASPLAFGLIECYTLCSYTFISLTAKYHLLSYILKCCKKQE